LKKSLRILLVIPTLELGGAERQAIHLAKYLQEENHEIEVWGFNSPNGLGAKFCDELGVIHKCLHFYGGLGRFRYPIQLFKWTLKFRSFNPDIIYSFTDGPNVLCALIWRYTGAKGFIWGQRSDKVLYSNMKQFKRALGKTKICISNSKVGIDSIKSNFKNHSNIDFHKVSNGIEKTKPIHSPKEWQIKLNIQNETKVALMISNFSETCGKDHKSLIKSWPKVIRKYPSAILLLAGRFDQFIDDYIQLAIDLGILHSIRFLGKIRDISGLISISDIIVHSSLNEGSPNAILEGMKGKKPIVATNIPGVKESLPKISHDYLVEVGDPRAFAEKIIELFNNTETSRKVANINLEFVNKNYSIQEMGEKTTRIILNNIN